MINKTRRFPGHFPLSFSTSSISRKKKKKKNPEQFTINLHMRITPPKADCYIIAPMEFHQLPSPDRDFAPDAIYPLSLTNCFTFFTFLL